MACSKTSTTTFAVPTPAHPSGSRAKPLSTPRRRSASELAPSGADRVYITTGVNFPDALGGIDDRCPRRHPDSPDDDRRRFPPRQRAELRALDAGRDVILGSEMAVGAACMGDRLGTPRATRFAGSVGRPGTTRRRCSRWRTSVPQRRTLSSFRRDRTSLTRSRSGPIAGMTARLSCWSRRPGSSRGSSSMRSATSSRVGCVPRRHQRHQCRREEPARRASPPLPSMRRPTGSTS